MGNQILPLHPFAPVLTYVHTPQHSIIHADAMDSYLARPDDRDCVSAECCGHEGGYSLASFAAADPATFLRLVHRLSLRDQDLLLSYYAIHIPQHTVGRILDVNQSNCSKQIREAVSRLAFLAYCNGNVTAASVRRIIIAAGIEDKLSPGIRMSTAIAMLLNTGDWAAVSEAGDKYIPEREIRSRISALCVKLSKASDPLAQALALSLVLFKNRKGSHLKRTGDKRTALHIPANQPWLGQFRVSLNDTDSRELFQQRADTNESSYDCLPILDE